MTEVPAEELERWTHAVSRALAGDFTDRPPMPERDDPWAGFCTGVRFLLDDLERAEARRRTEVNGMRELDRLKTRFVNMAAHELGTPLTPIALQAHLLAAASDRLDPGQRRALGIVQRNVARMQRLVGDLLDVARLESKELKLLCEPVDLGDVAREAAETFHDQAVRRGIALTHDLASGPVVGDPGRLAQVLDNLLSNALKCTPVGGTVHVGVRQEGDRVEVEVRDSGIGLTPDQVAMLFRPFSQAHTTVEGTGLGLFITRGIVERHGGLIACQSPGPGRGARFVVTLPARSAEAAAEVPGSATGAAAPARTAAPSPPIPVPWDLPRPTPVPA